MTEFLVVGDWKPIELFCQSLQHDPSVKVVMAVPHSFQKTGLTLVSFIKFPSVPRYTAVCCTLLVFPITAITIEVPRL